MKWLKQLLFVLLLCSFVSQPLFSRSYSLSEEQYQTLMNNLNQQEKKIELLDSQLLTLSLQLQNAEERAKNSEALQKKAEEYSMRLEENQLQISITVGSITFTIGLVIGTIVGLALKKM